MTIAASYLPMTAEGERDPTHYVLELSRRARGFATWAMIKHLGRSGIVDLVDGHCRAARAIAERLAADPSVEIVSDVQLNQVLVRFGRQASQAEGDRLTRETIRRIQEDGVCFAGGATWRGREVMRVSVSSWQTDLQQALAAADAMLDAWRVTQQGPSAHGDRQWRRPV
jgi:glutamate/tyrosine decarboxylase-like PLP-dependent enzyme